MGSEGAAPRWTLSRGFHRCARDSRAGTQARFVFPWVWGRSKGARPVLLAMQFVEELLKRPWAAGRMALGQLRSRYVGAWWAGSCGHGPGSPQRPSRNELVSTWKLEVVNWMVS